MTSSPKNFSIEISAFRTLNTKDSPVTMKNDELPMLINFMPIGQSLYTVPGRSEIKASTPVGTEIIRMFDVVIGSERYTMAATSDGALYSVDDSCVVVEIATAGTLSGDATGPFFAQWKASHLLVIDPNGYWSWDGTTFLDITGDTVLTGSINPTASVNVVGVGTLFTEELYVGATISVNDEVRIVATITDDTHLTVTIAFTDTADDPAPIHLRNAPTAGRTIVVWKGRVWIGGIDSTRRTIVYSAPDSYDDFQETSAGGLVVDNYASLSYQINALIGTQDYLYIVGDHATHIIAGLQVLTDGTTSFTLSDSIPGIGSIYPETVQVVGGTVYMMGDTGVYVVSGPSHELISSYLDGFFPKIDTSFSPIGFFAKIYNKNVYCLILKTISPVNGASQKWFACFYEGRWFFVFFGSSTDASSWLEFTYAVQRATATTTESYASYLNNIVQIFTGTTSMTKQVRTKAMNYEDSIFDKQILRVGAMLGSTDAFSAAFTANIRAYASITEGSATITFNPKEVLWYNGTIASPTQITGWLRSTGPDVFSNWYGPQEDLLAMAQCGGRGKRIALEYTETGTMAYTLAGFIMDGQIGAGW